MKTTLDSLREKIIAVVPDIVSVRRKKYEIAEGEFNSDDPSYGWKNIKVSRPITLADVLMTIEMKRTVEQPVMRMYADGEMVVNENASRVFWNLSESLENQSPEVIEFLNTLLP